MKNFIKTYSHQALQKVQKEFSGVSENKEIGIEWMIIKVK